MKKLTWFLVIAMVVTIMAPAFAAPLFPDVPDQHWARDAVADLAAKGILEGYPDGTFKGDRAATRWEMAMALQRLLAKMEAAHATFATKADLEALRALVNNLKDELDALGVRVKNLEENVSALDKRVTELERITFEGDFVTRLVTNGIRNNGIRTGSGVLGAPLPGDWAADVGGWNGSFAHFPGANNMFNWRPLTNGTGLTARARLGVKVKVNNDMDAGVRFAAYTSMGDQFIDAYWGVTAPYSSNPFTYDNGSNAIQNNFNSPWTRMTFDKFWIEHKPTNTMLVAGAIEKTNFDSFLVAPINNPGIDGRDRTRFADMSTSKDKKSRVSSWSYYEGEDGFLPFFGVQVSGKTHLFTTDMKWEAMYTNLPNEDFFVKPTLWGFNLDWKVKDQYSIKLNFARVSESTAAGFGSPQGYAPSRLPLGFAGMIGSGLEWTDPFDQTTVKNEKRPMRSGLPSAGFIGLQGQSMWGLSFNHRFDPSDIRVVLAYGGTNYKPNLESNYNVDGSHYRIGLGWTNKQNNFDVDVEYVSTDAYYDAFQIRYPGQFAGFVGLNMWNVPTFSYYGFGYQLHDSDMYPNNRNGLRFGLEYRFSNGNGRANLRGDFLQQNTTSNPHRDVTGVLNGMKPGFIDPIFHTLSTNGAGILNATPRGKVNHIGGGIEYKFAPSAFKANAQYDYYQFKRDAGALVTSNQGKINAVDLKHSALKIGLGYAFSDKFSLRGGFDWARMHGYHALFNGLWRNANTTVVDSYQTVPYLGFDYDIGKNTQWCFDVRFYNQTDKLTTNFNGDFNSPGSFTGVQMMTQFKVKF